MLAFAVIVATSKLSQECYGASEKGLGDYVYQSVDSQTFDCNPADQYQAFYSGDGIRIEEFNHNCGAIINYAMSEPGPVNEDQCAALWTDAQNNNRASPDIYQQYRCSKILDNNNGIPTCYLMSGAPTSSTDFKCKEQQTQAASLYQFCQGTGSASNSHVTKDFYLRHVDQTPFYNFDEDGYFPIIDKEPIEVKVDINVVPIPENHQRGSVKIQSIAGQFRYPLEFEYEKHVKALEEAGWTAPGSSSDKKCDNIAVIAAGASVGAFLFGLVLGYFVRPKARMVSERLM